MLYLHFLGASIRLICGIFLFKHHQLRVSAPSSVHAKILGLQLQDPPVPSMQWLCIPICDSWMPTPPVSRNQWLIFPDSCETNSLANAKLLTLLNPTLIPRKHIFVAGWSLSVSTCACRFFCEPKNPCMNWHTHKKPGCSLLKRDLPLLSVGTSRMTKQSKEHERTCLLCFVLNAAECQRITSIIHNYHP